MEMAKGTSTDSALTIKRKGAWIKEIASPGEAHSLTQNGTEGGPRHT